MGRFSRSRRAERREVFFLVKYFFGKIFFFNYFSYIWRAVGVQRPQLPMVRFVMVVSRMFLPVLNRRVSNFDSSKCCFRSDDGGKKRGE